MRRDHGGGVTLQFREVFERLALYRQGNHRASGTSKRNVPKLVIGKSECHQSHLRSRAEWAQHPPRVENFYR